MLTRRYLALSLLATTALAGCGTSPSPTPPSPSPGPAPVAPSWVVSDVNLVFTDLQQLLGQVGGLIGADLAAKIQAYLTVAQDLAGRVASAASTADLATTLRAFASAASAALQALSGAGVVLPGYVGVVIQAVQVLLPVILSVVGAAAPRRVSSTAAEAARSTLLRYRATGRL